jgi:hypothetical protein
LHTTWLAGGSFEQHFAGPDSISWVPHQWPHWLPAPLTLPGTRKNQVPFRTRAVAARPYHAPMSDRSLWRRSRAALLAGALAAVLVPVGGSLTAPTAGAQTLGHQCGPGVDAKWCPPLCVKLLSASQVGRIMHAGRLSGPVWHEDGVAEDFCTYSGGHDASIQVSVDEGATPSQFHEQLKVEHEFFPRATFQQLPPYFGKYAVSWLDCVPVVGCYPSVLVLSKGYLVEVSDQLTYASRSITTHRYLPEVEALAKAVLARA